CVIGDYSFQPLTPNGILRCWANLPLDNPLIDLSVLPTGDAVNRTVRALVASTEVICIHSLDGTVERCIYDPTYTFGATFPVNDGVMYNAMNGGEERLCGVNGTFTTCLYFTSDIFISPLPQFVLDAITFPI